MILASKQFIAWTSLSVVGKAIEALYQLDRRFATGKIQAFPRLDRAVQHFIQGITFSIIRFGAITECAEKKGK